MKYTSENIIGVKYKRPTDGDEIFIVVEIKKYSGHSSDLLIKGDKRDEPFLNSMHYVMNHLNTEFYIIVSEIVENFEIY